MYVVVNSCPEIYLPLGLCRRKKYPKGNCVQLTEVPLKEINCSFTDSGSLVASRDFCTQSTEDPFQLPYRDSQMPSEGKALAAWARSLQHEQLPALFSGVRVWVLELPASKFQWIFISEISFSSLQKQHSYLKKLSKTIVWKVQCYMWVMMGFK